MLNIQKRERRLRAMVSLNKRKACVTIALIISVYFNNKNVKSFSGQKTDHFPIQLSSFKRNLAVMIRIIREILLGGRSFRWFVHKARISIAILSFTILVIQNILAFSKVLGWVEWRESGMERSQR